MEMSRHFTASTYVVYGDKVLLHLHPKLQLWLPPGGHLERDELPHEAALREVKEEVGLSVELYGSEGLLMESRVREIPRPVHILLEDINEGVQHIDFIYYAKSSSDQIGGEYHKENNFCWRTPEDLSKLSVQKNVIRHAQEAISLLGLINMSPQLPPSPLAA